MGDPSLPQLANTISVLRTAFVVALFACGVGLVAGSETGVARLIEPLNQGPSSLSRHRPIAALVAGYSGYTLRTQL